MDVE
jgi:DNA-directed RNA polymerase I, II, and III subunit RPABC2